MIRPTARALARWTCQQCGRLLDPYTRRCAPCDWKPAEPAQEVLL